MLKRSLLLCLLACVSWGAVSSKLNIEESDGSPSTFPYKLIVSPGSLTDNGDGTATLAGGGGGAGGTTGGINLGNTYQTPYYSISGSSNVLSATSNLNVFPSSVTIPASLGLNVTYGATLGSSTVSDLTANQMVRTNASKKLVSSATLTTTELAGTLQAAQFPALTGDVTTTAGSLATTLASVVTANQYGSATVVPVITFDAKGRITAVSSATLSGGGSTSGTVNSGDQYKAAYYSEVGSSTTVSASDHFSIFTDSVTLNGNGLRMTGRNLFLGYNAGGTFADYGNGMNIGIGSDALRRLTAGTGYGNVAIGQIAGEFITTGANNVALGNGAGPDIATGTGNICIGSNDNVSSVQSCQGIVEGSSNTMVGTGSGGYTGSEYSGDSGNTFIGYGAGSALATRSVAIGYKARVSGDYQAQIGGTGVDGVTLNVSTFTTSSATISGQASVGTLQGAGLSTCGSSSQALSWNGGTFGCQTITTGSSGVVPIVNTASQQAMAYYSVSGTSNTLSGSTNMTLDDANSALVLGGGSRVDIGAMTINGNGSQTSLLHLNGTNNQFINFAVSGTSKGSYGVAFDGSDYYHRWRDSATGTDQMTLYTSGSNTGKLSVLGAPGLAVTYNVSVGSMTGANLSTCGDATHALGYNSTTGLFSCQSVTGSGGGGGASSLEVMVDGVRLSSPTPTLSLIAGANVTLTPVLAGGTTAQVTIAAVGDDFGNHIATKTITGNYGATISTLTVSSTVTISSVATITALVLGTTNYASYGSSGTITPDATMGNNISITLTSSATINVPINAQDFEMFRYRIAQDGAGSRTITLGSGFAFGTDVSSATFSTAANKVDYLSCIYRASSSKCDIVAPVIRGY